LIKVSTWEMVCWDIGLDVAKYLLAAENNLKATRMASNSSSVSIDGHWNRFIALPLSHGEPDRQERLLTIGLQIKN
jgi:hypothetical protein